MQNRHVFCVDSFEKITQENSSWILYSQNQKTQVPHSFSVIEPRYYLLHFLPYLEFIAQWSKQMLIVMEQVKPSH